MIDRVHAFEPDYAIPPGAILEEALEARSLSKSEFARRCGRPTKTGPSGAWADRFPVNELVKFDLIPEPSDTAETVQKLLDFFGVASVHAWERRFDPSAVAYRRSKAFESAP